MTDSRENNGLVYEIDWRCSHESDRRTKQALKLAVDRAKSCALELGASDPSESGVARLSINQLVFAHEKAPASSSSKTHQKHNVGSYFIQCQLENVIVDTQCTDESKKEQQTRLAYRICRRDDHKYSVKFLQPGIIESEHHAFAATEMILEAQILSSLARHAHISGIYGVTKAEMDGSSFVKHHHSKSWGFFYVTDWISETLTERMESWRQQKIKQQTESVNQRLEIALKISSALVYLHSRDIVTYIRPDKIGFDSTGTLKLFGIGQSRKAGSRIECCPSTIRLSDNINVLKYTAPELLCGNYPATLASDVYGFGMLLWEIYSLRIAMEGYTRARHYEEIVRSLQPPVTFLTVDDRWDSVLINNDDRHFHWSPIIQDIIETSSHPFSRPSISQVHDRLHHYLHQSSIDASSSYQDLEGPNDNSTLVKRAPPRSFSDEPLLELEDDDDDSEKSHDLVANAKEIEKHKLSEESHAAISPMEAHLKEARRVPPRRHSDCDDRSLWLKVAREKELKCSVECQDNNSAKRAEKSSLDDDDLLQSKLSNEKDRSINSLHTVLPLQNGCVLQETRNENVVVISSHCKQKNGKGQSNSAHCHARDINVSTNKTQSPLRESRQGRDCNDSFSPRRAGHKANIGTKVDDNNDLAKKKNRALESSSMRTIQSNNQSTTHETIVVVKDNNTVKKNQTSSSTTRVFQRVLSDPLLAVGMQECDTGKNDTRYMGKKSNMDSSLEQRASRRCCSAPKVRIEESTIEDKGIAKLCNSSAAVKSSKQKRRRTHSLDAISIYENATDFVQPQNKSILENEDVAQATYRKKLEKTNLNQPQYHRNASSPGKVKRSKEEISSNNLSSVTELKPGKLIGEGGTSLAFHSSTPKASKRTGSIDEAKSPDGDHVLEASTNSNVDKMLRSKKQENVPSSLKRAFHRSSSAPEGLSGKTKHTKNAAVADVEINRNESNSSKERCRRCNSFDIDMKTSDADVSIEDLQNLLRDSSEKKIVDYVHPKGTSRRRASSSNKTHHKGKKSASEVEKFPTDTPTTVLEESTSTMEISRHSVSQSSLHGSKDIGSTSCGGFLALTTPERTSSSCLEQLTTRIPSADRNLLFLPHQSDRKIIQSDDCSDDVVEWPQDSTLELSTSQASDSVDNNRIQICRKTASLSSLLPEKETRKLERSRTMDSLSLQTLVSKPEEDVRLQNFTDNMNNCKLKDTVENETGEASPNRKMHSKVKKTSNKTHLGRDNIKETSPLKNRTPHRCQSDPPISVEPDVDATASEQKDSERNTQETSPLKNQTHHQGHSSSRIDVETRVDSSTVKKSNARSEKIKGESSLTINRAPSNDLLAEDWTPNDKGDAKITEKTQGDKKNSAIEAQSSHATSACKPEKFHDASTIKQSHKQFNYGTTSNFPTEENNSPGKAKSKHADTANSTERLQNSHRRKPSSSGDECPVSITQTPILKENHKTEQSDHYFASAILHKEIMTPKLQLQSKEEIVKQCSTPSQGDLVQQQIESTPKQQMEIIFLPRPDDEHRTESSCSYQLPQYVSPLKQRSPAKCTSRRSSPFRKSGDVSQSPRIRKVLSCQSALCQLDKGVSSNEQRVDIHIIPSPRHTPVKTPLSMMKTRPDSCSSKHKNKVHASQRALTKKSMPSPASATKTRSNVSTSKTSGPDIAHSFDTNDYSFVDLFKGQPTAEVSLNDLVMRMNPVPDRSVGESVASTTGVASSDIAMPSLNLFELQPRTRRANVDYLKENIWLENGEMKRSEHPRSISRTASKSSVIKRLQQSVDQAENTEPSSNNAASPRKQGLFGNLLRGGNSVRNYSAKQLCQPSTRQMHQHPRMSVVANVVATTRLCDLSDHKSKQQPHENRKSQKS